VDRRLDEPAWRDADSIARLVQVVPRQGAAPTARTAIRVLVQVDALVFGVMADDPDPTGIVSFAKERDADLEREGHLRLVLDTFRDSRSGLVFAVNQSGARYDALVSKRGESENRNRDAVWEARTTRTAMGWVAEVRIPVRSLILAPGLGEWGFNIERHIQRLQETDRWASPRRANG
jgi:hypothetical protein